MIRRILSKVKRRLTGRNRPAPMPPRPADPKIDKVISVVLATLERKAFLAETIRTIREELRNVPHEIIVVDGGSADGTIEWLGQQKDIITIVQHNRGEWEGKRVPKRPWGYFINLGFKCASGKYVCMLSDDCLVCPGAIQNGVRFFEEQLAAGRKVGAVAFFFRDWPLRMKYAVANNLDQLYVNHGLYLRDALIEVGYANEDDYRFYYADTDLVLKMAHAGYECLPCRESFIEHYIDEEEILRMENNTVIPQDLETLLRLWKGKQFPPEREEELRKCVGYWTFIEPDYEDPANTADAFRRLTGRRA